VAVEGTRHPRQQGDILQKNPWSLRGSGCAVSKMRQELLAVVWAACDFENLARVDLLVLDLLDRNRVRSGKELKRGVVPGHTAQKHDMAGQGIHSDLGWEHIPDKGSRVAHLKVTEQFDKRVRISEGVEHRIVWVIRLADPVPNVVAVGDFRADDGDREAVIEAPRLIR
jgi:hypothetical protein